MSNKTNFYGEFTPGNIIDRPYLFGMDIVYLPQKSASLNEDSPDPARLFANLQMLQTAKDFLFSTSSTSTGTLLKTLVTQETKFGDSFFFKISAYINNYGLIANCYDCELAQSMLMTTPVGIYQSYEIKCKSVYIEHVAESTGSGYRERNSFFTAGRIFPFPGNRLFGF